MSTVVTVSRLTMDGTVNAENRLQNRYPVKISRWGVVIKALYFYIRAQLSGYQRFLNQNTKISI